MSCAGLYGRLNALQILVRLSYAGATHAQLSGSSPPTQPDERCLGYQYTVK